MLFSTPTSHNLSKKKQNNPLHIPTQYIPLKKTTTQTRRFQPTIQTQDSVTFHQLASVGLTTRISNDVQNFQSHKKKT